MTVAKQAGVGLMLGEEPGVDGVVVKQLVPRGSADRTGKIKSGDHLLKVGDDDVVGQKVADMRHLIIGELGSIVSVTLRSSATGQVYTVDLMRGTPEYFDSISGSSPPSVISSTVLTTSSLSPPPDSNREKLYHSQASMISTSREQYTSQAPNPSTAVASNSAMQEENDWLRSALRLAESHIAKGKEELLSLHNLFERHKEDSGQRIAHLEQQLGQADRDKREAEKKAWMSDEARRGSELKLQEAARREVGSKEEAKKAYENEQLRLDYIAELKRRFEEEKRALEKELVRLHDSMRAERARRVEQEATEAGLRQDLSRAHEAYKQAVEKNHKGAEKIRAEAESLREIQRQNSTLTLLLSEIQPRLTVLEQENFGSKVDYESVGSRGGRPGGRANDDVIMA